ncbi:MAG: hypothetical protein ABFD96_18005 [Armatimonadia bacterium]
MAGTTEFYGLTTGVVTDDFVEADHHNRVADTLDRVLGNVLTKLLPAGVYAGWEMDLLGKVGAGEGLVGGCWCRTVAAQAIEGLTAGATNYVFARAEVDSAAKGTVGFFGQLSAAKPAGAVLLGSVEVDGSGQVLSANCTLPSVDRHCVRMELAPLSGSGMVTAVGPNEEFTAQVSHGVTMRVPGAIEFASSSPDLTWELTETWRGDGFVVKGRNNGAVEADFVYTWTRQGFVE